MVPEEGFEPSVEDPKSPALPLGYSGSPGYQDWAPFARPAPTLRERGASLSSRRDLPGSGGVLY